MTTFERFEREIPRLMDELSPSQLPDYLDDMLRRTEQTRQWPAWSALERWLPMGVIARTQSTPSIPWRPILAVGLLLALAVATLLVVGSPRTVPEPYGPARNGDIVFGDNGDIVAADPTTGSVRTIIGGAEYDTDPWFTNDGRRFAFDRSDHGSRALWIANADGSGARQLLPAAAKISGFEWSPTGDRIALRRDSDHPGTIQIVDAGTGATTSFDLDMTVIAFVWRPGTDQLIVSGERTTPDARIGGMYLVGADGTGLKSIVEGPDVINDPTVSPDGSKLAYTTWGTGAEGRIHVIDLVSGAESPVGFDPADPHTDLAPQFSPDGRSIMVERYDADGYRLTILPVDGKGAIVAMDDPHPEMTNGSRAAFSPDGTKVLASYQDDGSTWLLDTKTGHGQQLSWPRMIGTQGTWQRLAP